MKNRITKMLLLIGATTMLFGSMIIGANAKTTHFDADELEYVEYSEEDEVLGGEAQDSVRLEDLKPATNLKWNVDGVPGKISFDNPNESNIKIVVYASINGGEYFRTMETSSAHPGTVTDVYAHSINIDGDYKFRVKFFPYGEKPDDDLTKGCVSEESSVYSYKKPNKSVGVVSKITVTENGVVSWDEIDNANFYIAWLYAKDGEQYNYVTGIGAYNNKADFSKYIASGKEYYVRIAARAINIEEYANGLTSNYIALGDVSKVTSALVGSIIKDVTESNAADIANTLKNEFKDNNKKDELRVAMQNNADAAKKIEDLENKFAANKKVVGTVETAADTGLDSSKVSVLGAKLNAKNDNAAVSFKISNPTTDEEKNLITNSPYAKAIGFSMDLTGAGIAPGEVLDVPVTVTMPMPMNIDYRALAVWHYNADGTHEVLPVRLNADGTISFTVTHFSMFVFGSTETIKPSDNHSVSSFVSRLYSIILNRDADEAGLNDWTNRLTSGEAEASQIVEGFVNSDEFTNRNLSVDAQVEILYRAMIGRASDVDGKKYWVNKLENGLSINSIVNGFSGSEEFGKICEEYKIKAGSISLGQPRDKNEGVTGFVARCYTKALGRSFDVDGINDWCNRILTAPNQRQAALDMASNGFFHSEEFGNKNTSNEDYVDILYRTFLGREADEAGKADWVGKLNSGVSRDDVMAGFSGSVEFDAIMRSYNL